MCVWDCVCIHRCAWAHVYVCVCVHACVYVCVVPVPFVLKLLNPFAVLVVSRNATSLSLSFWLHFIILWILTVRYWVFRKWWFHFAKKLSGSFQRVPTSTGPLNRASPCILLHVSCYILLFCIFVILFLIHYFLLSSTEEGEQQQRTPNQQRSKQTEQLLPVSLLNNHHISILQRLFSRLSKGHPFRCLKDDKWLIWLSMLHAARTEPLSDNNTGRQEATPYNMKLFLFLTPGKLPYVHMTRTANFTRVQAVGCSISLIQNMTDCESLLLVWRECR